MAPAMSSRIAVRRIGFTLILLLLSSAQAVDYEVHRHDVISANWNGNVILTSRDFLEQLNFVAPKVSYTLQEATEHLLHFGALLRARILDTFGSLLYVHYDDFSIAEVEALRKVHREILERRYDVFQLVPSVLRNPDTRPSRICAEIYSHTTNPCLRSSASICRRIRKHDLSHPDDRDTPAVNVTYQVYRLSKISKQYPRGFSLATLLRFLQREVLIITPDLLSGLLYNVRYESYDYDVRLAERELIRHFREIAKTSGISELPKLKMFHTMNSFFQYYIDTYAEKLPDNDLRKYALLIARRIADVGTIDENIHLLGNVYENQTIHIGYLFDLVLPDDLLENDVIEAKKYLVTKLNEFNVVKKYLKVQKYQQVTPAQLTMEITGQLRDIDFAKSIATSLRMHARFWRRSRMIESLDELLELFDTYENLRRVPHYLHMMQKIDNIKESLRDMKDIPVEILCNIPRACLRIGLQLILHCKFISSEIKNFIKNFLELSDVCVDPVYMIQESRRSVEIPFKISKVRTLITTLQTEIGEATTRHSIIENHDRSETMESTESEEITESAEISNESTEEVPSRSEISSEESSESMSMTTMTTMPRITTKAIEPISKTHQKETTAAITSTTTAITTTTLPATTTLLPTTTTTLPTITTPLPTTTTMLPTTTTLSITTTALPTTTTTSPTTTTTTLLTTSPTTITTMSPTTITTMSPTTTSTTLRTTTTTSPTTISTTLPTTTTTMSPTTTITALPKTTIKLPTTISTMLPTMTSTISPTISTTLPTTTTTSVTTTPIITTDVPMVNVNMKLKHSKIRTEIDVPYADDEFEKSFRNVTVVIATPAQLKSCESNECISEQSSEETSERVETTTTLESTTTLVSTTPTMQTSQATSPEPVQDFVTNKTMVSSSTELNETPVTKGDDCAKSCLEDCRPKSESVETSARSCETSCDSVTEDCNGKDNTPKDSLECKTEVDKSCGCVTKEERSTECMTLCPSDGAESSSCEGSRNDCMTSVVPTIDMKFERKRIRSMCEIRDLHHHRQLGRLAKMRAISAAVAAAAVGTSRVDVLRPRASRHRDQIATKKLYNLLSTRLPYSKDRKVTKSLLKRPLGGRLNGNDKDRRRRKQREQIYKIRRLARKLDGKLTQGTTIHRTKGITSFRHSQIDRISERDTKSISA